MEGLSIRLEKDSSPILLRSYQIDGTPNPDFDHYLREDLRILTEKFFDKDLLTVDALIASVMEIFINIIRPDKGGCDSEWVTINVFFSYINLSLIIQITDDNSAPVPAISNKKRKLHCPSVYKKRGRGRFMASWLSDYFCEYCNRWQRKNYHLFHFVVDIIPGDIAPSRW